MKSHQYCAHANQDKKESMATINVYNKKWESINLTLGDYQWGNSVLWAMSDKIVYM